MGASRNTHMPVYDTLLNCTEEVRDIHTLWPWLEKVPETIPESLLGIFSLPSYFPPILICYCICCKLSVAIPNSSYTNVYSLHHFSVILNGCKRFALWPPWCFLSLVVCCKLSITQLCNITHTINVTLSGNETSAS